MPLGKGRGMTEMVGLPKIGWRPWEGVSRKELRKYGHGLFTEPVLHSASAGGLVVLPM